MGVHMFLMNLKEIDLGRIDLFYQIQIKRGGTQSEIYCTNKKHNY